jgi:hypothetical protein
LEGIVAKRRGDPYLPEHARWLKIRNQNYSQWVGREELFERERETDPKCDCGTAAWRHVRRQGIRLSFGNFRLQLGLQVDRTNVLGA